MFLRYRGLSYQSRFSCSTQSNPSFNFQKIEPQRSATTNTKELKYRSLTYSVPSHPLPSAEKQLKYRGIAY
jgi:Domain of unknown function (DUF4278)